jgi:UDP-N-acetylglucosamine 1-carboxyvinyltransferase
MQKMEKERMGNMLIQGGIPLYGKVKVKGSKNASLPIMAAALLSTEPVTITGVPDLYGVHIMAEILRALGA